MYHVEYEEYDDMSREEWLEYRQEKKLEKREVEVERQKKMIMQRLLGIGMLLMFITVPLGLILLFSKDCCIV